MHKIITQTQSGLPHLIEILKGPPPKARLASSTNRGKDNLGCFLSVMDFGWQATPFGKGPLCGSVGISIYFSPPIGFPWIKIPTARCKYMVNRKQLWPRQKLPGDTEKWESREHWPSFNSNCWFQFGAGSHQDSRERNTLLPAQFPHPLHFKGCQAASASLLPSSWKIYDHSQICSLYAIIHIYMQTCSIR